MSKPNWLSLLKGLMGSNLMDSLVDIELSLKGRDERLLNILHSYIYVDLKDLEKTLGSYDADTFNENGLAMIKDKAQLLINTLVNKLNTFVLWRNDDNAETMITDTHLSIKTMWGFLYRARDNLDVLCAHNHHYRMPTEDDLIDYLAKGSTHVKFLLTAPNIDWEPKELYSDDAKVYVNRALFLMDKPKHYFKGVK